MINFKVTLLLVAVVLTASFGYAQNAKDSTVFHEKPIPEPTIYIGSGTTGGKQTKEILLENPFMSVTGECTIVSYKIVFVKNGVEDAPIIVKGARFSDEVISKIQSAPLGTVVEFTDIKVQSATGIRTIVTILMVHIE